MLKYCKRKSTVICEPVAHPAQSACMYWLHLFHHPQGRNGRVRARRYSVDARARTQQRTKAVAWRTARATGFLLPEVRKRARTEVTGPAGPRARDVVGAVATSTPTDSVHGGPGSGWKNVVARTFVPGLREQLLRVNYTVDSTAREQTRPCNEKRRRDTRHAPRPQIDSMAEAPSHLSTASPGRPWRLWSLSPVDAARAGRRRLAIGTPRHRFLLATVCVVTCTRLVSNTVCCTAPAEKYGSLIYDK